MRRAQQPLDDRTLTNSFRNVGLVTFSDAVRTSSSIGTGRDYRYVSSGTPVVIP